ncbi:hypothetical protein CSH63_17935 [Micromonospora tulbaghiae]|uniref:Phage tail protein n=1 Tax=Micromonospora tulbaghiae TaxID=479978 RepID=A0A386WM72_9ACTN|nr:hypothetical protein [Micromonospora tulbaghiae]AYF29311.1 hypothetical protein CSH63_17935 [Micromonospora tulbaghiae]
MAVDIELIRAYTDGLVATHDPTSPGVITPPTNASSPLASGFRECGAISDGGLNESTKQQRKDVFIWQKNALVRRIPGQFEKTWKFAAAETSLFNLGIQYPGSVIVSTTEGARVEEKPPTQDIRAWVLHGVDDARALRLYVPKGEVTERGDVVWSGEGITVYEWTLTGYLDTNGVVAYRHYLDPAMATP